MHKLRKRIAYTLASALGLSVLAVAPVWAQHGVSAEGIEKPSDSSTVATTTSTSDTQNDSSNPTSESDSLREQAKQLLRTKRANFKETTQEHKQKACAAHKVEINKRVDNYAKAAQRHLDVFNAIFNKVQAFQTKKQLAVPTYDALVATAKTKQAAAQTAVDTLKALDVSIDCAQPDPATSVATVKTATANARTALHDYRKAIKDVVVALKGASTSTDKSTNDNTSTDTNKTGGDQ